MKNSILFIVIFLSIKLNGFAQPSREFDEFSFYDSSETIQNAFELNYRKKIHGYLFHYDLSGEIEYIAEYKRGKEKLRYFPNGEIQIDNIILVPGCGTGKMKNRNKFADIYFQFTGIDLRKRKDNSPSKI